VTAECIEVKIGNRMHFFEAKHLALICHPDASHQAQMTAGTSVPTGNNRNDKQHKNVSNNTTETVLESEPNMPDLELQPLGSSNDSIPDLMPCAGSSSVPDLVPREETNEIECGNCKICHGRGTLGNECEDCEDSGMTHERFWPESEESDDDTTESREQGFGSLPHLRTIRAMQPLGRASFAVFPRLILVTGTCMTDATCGPWLSVPRSKESTCNRSLGIEAQPNNKAMRAHLDPQIKFGLLPPSHLLFVFILIHPTHSCWPTDNVED